QKPADLRVHAAMTPRRGARDMILRAVGLAALTLAAVACGDKKSDTATGCADGATAAADCAATGTPQSSGQPDASPVCKAGEKLDAAKTSCVAMTVADAKTAADCHAIKGYFFDTACHVDLITCASDEQAAATGESCA